MNYIGQRLVRAHIIRRNLEDRISQGVPSNLYPADARIFAVEIDKEHGNFELCWVYIESEEFAPVPDGGIVPERLGMTDELIRLANDIFVGNKKR